MAATGGPAVDDPISALAALLAPGGRLARQCGFCYELRLHRARGYGALKAILEILAEEEGLTLTEISHRLQRTPGSTKDYLSWLEDVDLVTSRQKRYSYTDPLLRVWVRLHCRASAPTEDDLAREVHRYALPRLPQQQRAGARDGGRRRRTVGRGSQGVGHYRDRLIGDRDLRSSDELSLRAPACAASCSASFLLVPRRLGHRLAVHHHLDLKQLAMIGTERADQPVLGQRRVPRLHQFLQRRLVVLPGRRRRAARRRRAPRTRGRRTRARARCRRRDKSPR